MALDVLMHFPKVSIKDPTLRECPPARATFERLLACVPPNMCFHTALYRCAVVTHRASIDPTLLRMQVGILFNGYGEIDISRRPATPCQQITTCEGTPTSRQANEIHTEREYRKRNKLIDAIFDQ